MIVPEDARFPAWDFIHYAVKHKENVTRRVVSFVQVTVSQGKQLQSGIWTADPNHPAKMQNETGKPKRCMCACVRVQSSHLTFPAFLVST